MAEEYLADHFPTAPVMPGVLMLESLVQASAWLIRATDDFAHSMVTLKQARGVKYKNFVEPGQTLHVHAEIIDHGQHETKLKAHGQIEETTVVTARLIMERYNLADIEPSIGGPVSAGRQQTDQYTTAHMRQMFVLLHDT